MIHIAFRLAWYLAITLIPFSFQSQIKEDQIKENMIAHTAFLASDALAGRGVGKPGIRDAANYIAEQFKAIGLRPFHENSYHQKFPYPGLDQMETNVVGYIPAKGSSERSIVITAHFDGYGVITSENSIDSISTRS